MKFSSSHTYRPDRQRGIAAVETVIVLPILLLAFLATAEIGRAMLHYNTLAKGVRDAGGYLAHNALDDNTTTINLTSQLQTDAKNLARYGDISGIGNLLLPNYADTYISFVVPPAVADEHVTVIANYPYQPMLFNTLPLFGFGNDISVQFNMQSSITVRGL